MRALLTLPVRTVGACTITALALTLIAATAAGYAGHLFQALIVLVVAVVAFSGTLIVILSVGHVTGVLEANPKEGSAHVDH